jgi:hypothetical protein
MITNVTSLLVRMQETILFVRLVLTVDSSRLVVALIDRIGTHFSRKLWRLRLGPEGRKMLGVLPVTIERRMLLGIESLKSC